MALSIYEQIIEYIKESRRVVVALDKDVSADSLGAAFALSFLLDKFQKPHKVAVSNPVRNFSFLTKNIDIDEGFRQARRLVITLDIANQGLEKFYYTTDEEHKKLEVFIVPRDGFFNPDDVRVQQGGFEYDLIITIGAHDLFHLGSMYQENTAFFHETPIINIDSHAANEKFGEINLVESIKSSVCEIVFDFIEKNSVDILTAQVATALLSGILEKTQSFRVPTLAPQTLEKASKLMGYKADRERIVRELFYNKSLSLVKLWGRVLARLKEDKEKNVFWSLINTDDYVRANAEPQIVYKVFAEVLDYLPQESVILLFSEFNNAVMVLSFSGDPHIKLTEKFADYKLSETENRVEFKVWGKDLLEVEREVIEKL